MQQNLEATRQRCAETAEIGHSSFDWIRDPKNHDTVKPEREALSREFRRHVVESRKLEAAIVRPMALGVFGASQAGKSYLVSRLASSSPDPLKIRFADLAEPLDFVEQINPPGGQESTAIATRFSVRQEPTPAGFPVVVRLFSTADLIQIVGDIYYTGFDIKDEPEFSAEGIDAILAKVAAEHMQTSRPIVTKEDFWTIRDFFDKKHREKANVRSLLGHGYWDRAEPLVESVDAGGLALLFSPVWAGVDGLTALIQRLISPLVDIGFPEKLCCPIETLVEAADGGHQRHPMSIINVSTLEAMLSDDPGGGMQVVAPNGSRGRISRAVLGALIAELNLTIGSEVWDFLKETDLIDFPGLRPPEVMQDFRKGMSDHALLGRVFKDAKVRFLFERFKADQELNGLVLCIGDSVQDVPGLPILIDEWISATHGATAQERRKSVTSLFIVLTKFDRELEGKRGDTDKPVERWEARLKSSLLDRLGAQFTWLNEWTPGKPFQSLFWFRNPNIRNPGIMEYESAASNLETGINTKEQVRFGRYRQGYLESPNVRRYFADPERAWEEVFKLNDGGLSYIVEAINPVCNRALKINQIADRIAERRRGMHERLGKFYIATDAASQRARRLAELQKVGIAVARAAADGRMGRVLQSLAVSDSDLADRFTEIARRASIAPRRLDPDEIFRAAFGGGPTSGGLAEDGAAATGTLADQLATAAIDYWAESMRAVVEDPRFRGFLAIPDSELGNLVNELIAGSTRLDLTRAITEPLRAAVDHAAPTHSAIARAALLAADRINRFVMGLGYDALPLSERPKRSDRKSAIFAADDSGIASLTEVRTPFAKAFYTDWLIAYRALVESNAERVDGSGIDVAENERLKVILDRLAA